MRRAGLTPGHEDTKDAACATPGSQLQRAGVTVWSTEGGGPAAESGNREPLAGKSEPTSGPWPPSGQADWIGRQPSAPDARAAPALDHSAAGPGIAPTGRLLVGDGSWSRSWRADGPSRTWATRCCPAWCCSWPRFPVLGQARRPVRRGRPSCCAAACSTRRRRWPSSRASPCSSLLLVSDPLWASTWARHTWRCSGCCRRRHRADALVVRMVLRRALPPERCLVLGSQAMAGSLDQRLQLEQDTQRRGGAAAAAAAGALERPRGPATPGRRPRHSSHGAATIERVIVAPDVGDGDDEVLEAIRRLESVGVRISLAPRMLEVVGRIDGAGRRRRDRPARRAPLRPRSLVRAR